MFERTEKAEFSAIPRLVEVLERIHNKRQPRSQGPISSPDKAIDAHPGLIDLLLGGAVDQAQALGQQFRSVAEPNAGAEADGPNRYQVLREELRRLEAKARLHAGAVERRMTQAVPGGFSQAASCYQETLYLQCRRLGTSGGRFRCENFRGQQTEVRALSGRFMAGTTILPIQPQLIFRPDKFVLKAGASMIVAVEIDLSTCVDLAVGKLEASVDLLMNDAVALKLWIEVEVYDVPR